MNKYLVEFLGTTLLAFVIFYTNNWMAIGAILGICVLLGGSISGGAFNPAITIALYQAGKIHNYDVIPYMVVQILGALAGFYAYKQIKK